MDSPTKPAKKQFRIADLCAVILLLSLGLTIAALYRQNSFQASEIDRKSELLRNYFCKYLLSRKDLIGSKIEDFPDIPLLASSTKAKPFPDYITEMPDLFGLATKESLELQDNLRFVTEVGKGKYAIAFENIDKLYFLDIERNMERLGEGKHRSGYAIVEREGKIVGVLDTYIWIIE